MFRPGGGAADSGIASGSGSAGRGKMRITEIRDIAAPELDIYARLNENQLYRIDEPRQGLFIAESSKVIRRALDAGFEPVSFLVEDRFLSKGHENDPAYLEVRDVLPEGDAVPVFTAGLSVLEKITGYKLTRGVLCAMRRKALPETGELLKRGSGRGTGGCGADGSGTEGHGTDGCGTGGCGTDRRGTDGCDTDGCGADGAGFGEQREMRRIAVLDRIMNPTNVGAIVRSAAALGMDAVILSGGCADPLQRRAVRVSMGCIFQIPWTVVSDTGALLREMKESGYVTCAMALSEHAASIEDPALGAAKKLAVVLGSEGDGLPDETVAACDYTVKIPMFHGADSLNVAAAAAIAFFVLGRGRGPLQPMQS